MKRIPLRARDGAVRAWVLVSDRDYGWLNQWTWRLDGYAVRGETIKGKFRLIFMHRLILDLEHGDPRFGEHKNRNKLDCRRSNLCIATRAELDNGQNPSLRVDNTSGYRGVSWHKRERKWVAYAKLNGRTHHLGYFATAERADIAIKAWRAEHMPFSEDARLRARETTGGGSN